MSKSKNNKDATSLSITIPAKLCREHTSEGGKNIFHTVSFMFKNAWASFIPDESDITPCLKRNGEIIENKFSLNLGSADDIRMVSVAGEDGNYKVIPFFNRSIASFINQAKQDYLRSIAI